MAIDNKNDYKGMNAGSTVAIAVKDGYCVWVDDLNASVDDVALAIEIGKTSGVGSGWQADLLFTDGTRETVSLKSGEEVKSKEYGQLVDSTNSADYDKSLQKLANNGDKKPFLVSYSKTSGKYKLTMASDDEGYMAGYDMFSDASGSGTDADPYITIKNNRFTKGGVKLIDDNATVLVRYDDGDSFRVITGKTLKGWSDSTKIYNVAVLADESNGTHYAKLAYVNLEDKGSIPGGADTLYAYLFSGPSSMMMTTMTTTNILLGMVLTK